VLRDAPEPPESRGLDRADVAMLVATRSTGSLVHARFPDLPRFLEPGDILVVNTSATLPAAVPAFLGEQAVILHLSTPASDGCWMVELRSADLEPVRPVPVGARLALPGGASAELVAAYPGSDRLVRARLVLDQPVEAYLRRYGAPIRYGHAADRYPIDAYQTVFAREPGSAEMPSAGRPFTAELVTELVTRGVLMAPVTLHTGVSSLERDEQPYPERFRVPRATAELLNARGAWGGRAIAVGTTVVRALETAATRDGPLIATEGWTQLVVRKDRPLRAVEGVLTGWHDWASSHLELLEAVAGVQLLKRSYAAARLHGFRLHEFGDVHLILP
jgi:S-adenosylmethionine:tRNA ribosyltransferase-isomerase